MTRMMNLGLQKHTILKIFNRFNPEVEPDNLDWDNLDDTCKLSENLDNMKNAHPQYVWEDELPKWEHAEHNGQLERLHEAGVEDAEVMERILSIYNIDDFSNNLLSKLAKQEQRQVGEIFYKVVKIKPTTRKGKGKTYSYGCIQNLFDSKYVGLKAKIIVFGTKYSECIDEDLEDYYNI